MPIMKQYLDEEKGIEVDESHELKLLARVFGDPIAVLEDIRSGQKIYTDVAVYWYIPDERIDL